MYCSWPTAKQVDGPPLRWTTSTEASTGSTAFSNRAMSRRPPWTQESCLRSSMSRCRMQSLTRSASTVVVRSRRPGSFSAVRRCKRTSRASSSRLRKTQMGGARPHARTWSTNSASRLRKPTKHSRCSARRGHASPSKLRRRRRLRERVPLRMLRGQNLRGTNLCSVTPRWIGVQPLQQNRRWRKRSARA